MKKIKTLSLALLVFACVIGLGVFIGLLGSRDSSVSPLPVTHNHVTQAPPVQTVHAAESSAAAVAHTNRVQFNYHIAPVLPPKN